MSLPLSPEPPLDPPASTAEPITFSLWHLFVFTATVAGVFALLRVIDSPLGPDIRYSDNAILEATFRVLYGLTLGALVVGGVERTRARAFGNEPGHALLVFGALQFMDTAILHGVFTTLVPEAEPSFIYMGFSAGVRCCVALLAAWIAAPRIYWKVFFLLWAGDACFDMVVHAASLGDSPEVLPLLKAFSWWEFGLWPRLSFSVLTLCAFIALWRRPWPDWLHWLGIALPLTLGVCQFLPV